MKAFLKQVLAVLVALSLFCFALLVLVALMLGSQEISRAVEPRTLLTLDLGIPIGDRPPREEFSDLLDNAMQGRSRSAYTLREVVTAIDRAAEDSRISGLYIKGQVVRSGYRSGWAALREVREAIQRFRASGKPVITWQETLDEATLYVVSPANHILLHPLGMVEFNGLAAEVLYFRDAFDRYGVGVQAVRDGKYKSAVEPFVSNRMSEANRAQLEALLGDLSREMISAIATSRKLEPQRLDDLVQRQGLVMADEARQLALVTALGHFDVALARLRKLTGTKPGKPIERRMDVADYFDTLKETGGDKVAVIYLEGTIVSGNDPRQVGAERLARLLRKAREDDAVKAVVLRINSPGGSATAADVIEREVRLYRKQKPLVVSMGTVAASGGYWVAAPADEIWVEPNTITGSIGVFGLFFNLQQLTEEHGVRREVVRTGPFADFQSLFRAKSQEELDRVQRLVDRIYEGFLQRVAQGRGMRRDRVEALAQGRVWSGRQALVLGLADHEGGLREAIAAAARRAQLESYRVLEYQRAESWANLLLRALGLTPEENDARDSEMESRWRELLQWLRLTADPLGIYARMPFDLSIH